jgi:hypothetical protein
MYLGLAVCSLVFILASCEREVNSVVAGDPVKLRFSANEISYGANENVTRSDGSRVLESVDIARQGRWTISADLVEDDCSLTRAVSDGLVNGAQVLIVVYNNADAKIADGVYTYDAATTHLIGADITVNSGESYRFAACSYNSTIAAPSYAETISGISPENDLLWGRTNPTLISVDDQQVIIGLSHQFMKVRLRTDIVGGSTPELSNLGASLTTNYEAGLTVLNGTVAKGTLAAAYTFTDADAGSDLTGPDANLSSDYGLVYTGGDDLIRAKINVTLTDGGAPKSFTDLPVSFNKQLAPGHSYTLQVTFRKFASFAASNIYWNGRYLTFDAVANADSSNTRYQGVYFKFGSLVGASPVGDGYSNIKIYVPAYNGGISPSWDGTKTVASKFGDWENIPCTEDGSSSDRANTWVTDDDRNTPAKWSAYIGDICRYISENGFGPGGKWRLPTAAEFGPSTEYEWGASSGWEQVSGKNGNSASSWNTNNDDPSPDGKRTSIRSGGRHIATQNFFPASGMRDYDMYFQGPINVGSNGYYGSASTRNSSDSYYFSFDDYYLSRYYRDRKMGYSVRCVLQE